jgi:threonylcarbamoyladenosine tRNA methylthiotransferase MtaB
MAQRLSFELRSNYGVDLVVGPYHSPAIGSIIKNYIQNQNVSEFTSQDVKDFASRIHPSLVNHKDELPWHKWVTISHGCENYCAYCIVPYVRGSRIRSKPIDIVLKEAWSLAKNNHREIVLTGIHLGAYGVDFDNKLSLVDVVKRLHEVNGIERIRLSSIEPMEVSDELIEALILADQDEKLKKIA